MQPTIGISAGYYWEKKWFFLARPYIDSVSKAGGLPIIIPTLNKSAIKKVLAVMDGFLLSGGYDVSPVLYGDNPYTVGKIDPERDRFEIEIVKLAWKLKMPILAICRGIQVLNVALGGTLKQKVEGLKHFQQSERCYPSHGVKIEDGSLFYKTVRRRKLMVNSFHHDGIDRLASVLKASAWAGDRLVEAVEAKEPKRFVLGVQFHPECMYDKYPVIRKIFSRFVSAAAKYKSRAR